MPSCSCMAVSTAPDRARLQSNLAPHRSALQGGLAVANGAPAPAVVNPVAALGGAAASPTSFRAALAKLATCPVLSATGNALVSYFSTLLGEGFANRLKGQLMEVSVAAAGGRRRAWQAFFLATVPVFVCVCSCLSQRHQALQP